MVLLHILPKKHFNVYLNEHGDIFQGSHHLGELNLYCENDMHLVGPTGPMGPTIKGHVGLRGEQGNTGPIGRCGNGMIGPLGDTGIDGCMGYVGSVGVKGRQGSNGPMGLIGDKGDVILSNAYLSAIIKDEFIYNSNGTYQVLPWTTIINNTFKLMNNIIQFPNKYGIYKIETCFQLLDCNEDVIEIELLFNNNCKKYY